MIKKIWWTLTVFWIVVFGGLATFIYIREVDATGVVQTPELKWFSLALLGALFIFIAIYHLIFLFIINKRASI
ncbi:DUF3923 family protein [Solibacillus sp. NPDC093137]|uniref:DUF3923 family protein n=1 Tax=Solibacillus sp. NPDC093137 TaxID=3390678 RepID=UPI003D03C79C